MVQRQNVEFAAEDDVILRGWLFVPDGPGPHPAITMAHGFAGVKEHGLERFAQVFAAAGFVVLVHDHRGFGASDGSPRYDIDPWVQIADWRRAISFLESQPFVDPDRIGLWGSSYAGGHAIVLGATDRRLRAVVAQVPTISGYQQSLRRVAPDQVPALEAAFADDERQQFHGAPPATQAVVSADPSVPAAYRAPDAIAFYTQPVPDGRLGQRRDAALDPCGAHVRAGHLDRPGLPDTAADGRGPARHHHRHRPGARRLRAALQPKKLVTIDGGHFDPYLTRFAEASGAAVAWFTEHLNTPVNH